MSDEKVKIAAHLKQKGVSSVNFCRAQKLIAGRGGWKTGGELRADLSLIGGWYGQLPEPLAVFPSECVSTTHYTISYLYTERKSTKRGSSCCILETSPSCAVLCFPLSVRPGASSGLRSPLRSSGGNQEKRAKSDTLAGLGVCVNQSSVSVEKIARSDRLARPVSPKNTPNG